MTDTILFDLDGTLLDSLNDLWASVNYALAQNNMPLRKKSEVRSFLGNGAKHLITNSLPNGCSSDIILSTYKCFKSHYILHSMDTTKPYDGIIELLDNIKRHNFKTGIISNKPDKAVQHLYKKYFRKYIDIAIGETEGIKRKPYPDMIIKALHLLNSSPQDSIYIGDSEVDIATALNSELRCISVSWGYRDRKFLESHNASIIIDKPSNLFNNFMI